MVINFETPLIDLDGIPLLSPDSKSPMTLSSVSVTALVTLTDADQSTDAKTKYEWGLLANKIHGKRDVDLSTENIVLLKSRVGRLYGPLIVVQVWDMLEGS